MPIISSTTGQMMDGRICSLHRLAIMNIWLYPLTWRTRQCFINEVLWETLNWYTFISLYLNFEWLPLGVCGLCALCPSTTFVELLVCEAQEVTVPCHPYLLCGITGDPQYGPIQKKSGFKLAAPHLDMISSVLFKVCQFFPELHMELLHSSRPPQCTDQEDFSRLQVD